MKLPVFFALAALGLSTSTAYADSWRCREKLVATGDLTLDVRARCGEPQLIETRKMLRKIRDERGLEKSKTSAIEEWTYKDSTGRELLRTLVFEDGRLVSILIGGRPPEDLRRCERQMFPIGATSAELRLACGEPTTSDQWIEYLEEEVSEGVILGKSIKHERLVYNFGPQRFLRIFELADGRLSKQSTGGYGY